jgi:hypothetical protein
LIFGGGLDFGLWTFLELEKNLRTALMGKYWGEKKTREIGTEIFSWRKTTTFRGPSISSTFDFFSSPCKKKNKENVARATKAD